MDSNKYSLDQLIGFIVAGTIVGIFGLLACHVPVPRELWDGVVFAGLAALFRAAN